MDLARSKPDKTVLRRNRLSFKIVATESELFLGISQDI